MKRILLRAAIAIVVTGCLYAVYLWAAGEKVQFFIVFVIVAVPLILTAHRIFRGNSMR
jgi:hypothetical protein